MDILNASQHPKVYYCRHMQPGTALYEGDKSETILVDLEGMKNLIKSVGKDRGIPVYVNHQPVDLKNIKEQAHGYVTDSFYNPNDGWAWFKFIAVDDVAHEAINKGWAVSNAYLPSQFGAAGKKNNVPYNREVLNGQFTHLAIVPDPRYEGAKIFTPDEFKAYQDEKALELHNSKSLSQEKKPMFKLFKTEKKEISGGEVDLDTHVEFENGKSLSIREMVEAVIQNEKVEAAVIDVGGKKMTVEQLKTAYENAKMKKMKKNSDDDDSEGEDGKKKKDIEADDASKNPRSKENKKMKKNAGDEMEEEDCENSDDDEAGDEEKKEDKEKKNKSKEKKNSIVDVEKSDEFFNAMRDAANRARIETRPVITTSIDQIERGRQRYGSDKK